MDPAAVVELGDFWEGPLCADSLAASPWRPVDFAYRNCIYCIYMKEISYGVRELQANLGQALRAVRRGDRIVVTSHGRPVATIAKADPSVRALPSLERKLLRLAAEGKLILGKRGPIPDYAAPRIGGLAKQVLADRR